MPDYPTASSELAAALAEARAVTDNFFTHLDPAAIYDRPIAERHRMIFYLGHLEAFDWNQMKQAGMTERSPVESFDNLFAFGIDPPPGLLPQDVPADWPDVAQVCRYNAGVRERIDRALSQAPADVVHMMVEHRHMHAETLAYILHSLPAEKKSGPREQLSLESPVENRMLNIPAGIATLGLAESAGFGWDNEFCEMPVTVPSFSISRFKVTNGEWLKFMEATGAAAPYYWFQDKDRWFYRGVFESIPLPPTWPVYVTHNQAASYARFHKKALPTEAQFHRAAFGTPRGEERQTPWSSRTPADTANFGYRHWDPVGVNATPETDSAFGVSQLVGNGWEWTSSVFAPFAGFSPRPTYPGYSANFFDGEHFVLKGASPRTAEVLVRRSLRNWFRPEYPYVYATFHLVDN